MQKRTLITIGLLFIMCLLLLFPNLCLQAAQNGLLLWFNKVLPSLLPFIIFINILVPLDGLHSFISWCTPLSRRLWHLPGESLFAFIMGLIAGYPMGAKVVKSLYLENRLTKIEAERTLCFCNNCGPLFMIGTIGTAMLSQTELGYFLFFIHLISALIMSFFITHNLPSSSDRPHNKQITSSPPSFFKLLNLGVMNAMDTIVCVGGYIIFFSVLLALLTQTPFAHYLLSHLSSSPHHTTIMTGILSSILELSNGAYALSQLPISIYSLALLSAATGFGGICVYFQALFVLEDTPFDVKPFFISKCIQGFLSFALTLLLWPLYSVIFHRTAQDILYTSNTTSLYSPTYLFIAIILIAMSFIAAHFIFQPTSSNIHYSSD